MKKLLLALASLALIFGFTPKAEAAWEFASLHQDIIMQSDGMVKIVETIKADFENEPHHGIYRDFILKNTLEDGTERWNTLDLQSITQDGNKAKYSKTNNYESLRYQIGDADVEITGEHTYVLTYLTSGTNLEGDFFDSFNWNVVGNGWSQNIRQATANITFPNNVSIEAISCKYGSYGTGDQNCQVDKNNSTISLSLPEGIKLYSGDSMSVFVDYQKSALPIIVPPRPLTMGERIAHPGPILLGFWVLIIGLYYLARIIYYHGRDRVATATGEKRIALFTPDIIMPEYEPPIGLRPAEVGVLIGQHFKSEYLTATIVDLATRGYLKIEEIEKKGIFSKTDYNLTKLKPADDGLKKYEKILMDELFDIKETVSINDLKGDFGKAYQSISDAVVDGVCDQKLFNANPSTSILLGFVAGILIGFVGFVLMASGFAAYNPYIAMIGIPLVFIGFVTCICSFFLPSRTAKGHAQYLKAKGYQLFIGHTEKYRQKFFEKENVFMEVLPYAIAFSLTDKLADGMRELGYIPSAPVWYIGTHPFNLGSFSDGMSSLNTGIATSMGPVSSAGSASGGGGFSGGGFGGGGGGGW